MLKCPLSGISCKECRFYQETDECFLKTLLQNLEKIADLLESIFEEKKSSGIIIADLEKIKKILHDDY